MVFAFKREKLFYHIKISTKLLNQLQKELLFLLRPTFDMLRFICLMLRFTFRLFRFITTTVWLFIFRFPWLLLKLNLLNHAANSLKALFGSTPTLIFPPIYRQCVPTWETKSRRCVSIFKDLRVHEKQDTNLQLYFDIIFIFAILLYFFTFTLYFLDSSYYFHKL